LFFLSFANDCHVRLDINYGGSSGFGREYIRRLARNWGIIDVGDCINALEYLSSGQSALIDPNRAAIRGGSAGGFTTLAALANAPDPKQKLFKAGTSYYGISNLILLAEDSQYSLHGRLIDTQIFSTAHKFESHYMEKLLGGTYQEIPEVYIQRSPVTHANRIVSPLLVSDINTV
jgi:dipeptidyl aminopeptidase/acylaminoacyl peptidase